jgi:hypothetical protein
MDYTITNECISRAACEPQCSDQITRGVQATYVTGPDQCLECAGVYKSSPSAAARSVDAPAPGPNHPEPTCAPTSSESGVRDGQIEGQAPVLTEDDSYLVALALFLVSGIWQITSSYLK